MFNIYFLFDLINILHEKAGMFSYIIAGRSFTVHAVFIKSGSVYQPLTSAGLLCSHRWKAINLTLKKQKVDQEFSELLNIWLAK